VSPLADFCNQPLDAISFLIGAAFGGLVFALLVLGAWIIHQSRRSKQLASGIDRREALWKD